MNSKKSVNRLSYIFLTQNFFNDKLRPIMTRWGSDFFTAPFFLEVIMLSESEWEEIKKELLLIYETKNCIPQNEIEKKLSDLLVEKKGELQIIKLKKIGEKYVLSRREVEVLAEILDGRTNSEISEHLSISISTVKKHVYNIFNKICVNSRSQLLNLVFTME